jgi:hypothetical protein
MNEELHESYHNDLNRLFRNHKKEYYDLVFPRNNVVNDFTEILDFANVRSVHEACKWIDQNLSVREIYTLPWTFTLEYLPECKKVTVVADFAQSLIEENKYDMSKIVIDVKTEPYETVTLKTKQTTNGNKTFIEILEDNL